MLTLLLILKTSFVFAHEYADDVAYDDDDDNWWRFGLIVTWS